MTEIVWLFSSLALFWLLFELPIPRLPSLRRSEAVRVSTSGQSVPRAPNERRRLALGYAVVAAVRTVGAGVQLPLVLATDVVADLAKCPHVLVAGASGSGKSVALHAIVQGLLASGGCELWLIDPKMVEAAPYKGLERCRVVYRDGAVGLLVEAIDEMDRRYREMLAMGLRQWEENAIVVVVDEYGDLILGGGREAKETERLLVRLAQMGRAASIHLILATQRPSADVVTPLIRANIPARLALRCASASNSRIVLGDARAYDELSSRPVGSAIWSLTGDVVRAPYVDPYNTGEEQ